jgi:hypothetical protein
MLKFILMLCIAILYSHLIFAQKTDSLNQQLDSLFIDKFEKKKEAPLKLLHAEPLYIDLIRDLGARKGEKEWNFGFGLTDNLKYDEYEALVEYEWAPVDRLGLELELPFHFYYSANGTGSDSVKGPGSRLNSLKLAAQYTFLVNEKAKTSMAIGYLHEFLMPAFRDYAKSNLLAGHLMEPFLIAAKRWGSNYHTLLYTGPIFEYTRSVKAWNMGAQANLSFHYMIPGTRNFIGVETNSTLFNDDYDLTIRPQMRVGLADNLLIGVVAGIPIKRENQRLSSFVRIIYEPAEHNRKKGLKNDMVKRFH